MWGLIYFQNLSPNTPILFLWSQQCRWGWSLSPSRKSLVYQRFVSISSYYICCDLLALVTIALRFVSIHTNLFLIDSFSPPWLGNGLKTDPMHSTQCIHTKMHWQTVPGLCTIFQIKKSADTKWTHLFLKTVPGNRQHPSECARTGSLQFPLVFSVLPHVICL